MATARLVINVDDIDVVIGSFNVIRIKRSVTDENGPFELLTANAPAAASLTAPTAGNYTVAGKQLQFEYDIDSEVDITFTGVAPLTAAMLASQINAAAGETVAYDDSGTLRLTSPTTGTASRMEIIGGDSLTDFGWTAGDRDIGEDAHVALIEGQALYDYTDKDGSSTYWYRAQYYSTITGLASQDGPPFQGTPGTVVPASNLSKAVVQLADGAGIAIRGQKITFYSSQELIEVDGFTLGLQRAPIATIETDSVGEAEIVLVRGMKVKVVFEGTSVIREFIVPDVDEFNLLTEISTAPDPFDITELPFNLAIRRTT